MYDGVSIAIRNCFLFYVSPINITFRHRRYPFHRKGNGKTSIPKVRVVVGDIIKLWLGIK